jgi:hypothetical protein
MMILTFGTAHPIFGNRERPVPAEETPEYEHQGDYCDTYDDDILCTLGFLSFHL